MRHKLQKLIPRSNQAKYDWQALENMDHNLQDRVIEEFRAIDEAVRQRTWMQSGLYTMKL